MRLVLSLEGREFRAEAFPEGDGLRLRLLGDGVDVVASASPLPGGFCVRQGRRTLEAGVTRDRSGNVIVQIEGESFRFDSRRAGAASGSGGPLRARGGAAGGNEVRTPMPGRVVRILRAEGDSVEAGDGVLVLEAMKMQNEIPAPATGVIATMKVSAGTHLKGGESLFSVEPVSSS